MKHIPETLPLALFATLGNPAEGYSEQHHRNEEHRVGVVSFSRGGGTGTTQRWYCDYARGVTCGDLKSLALVMASTSDLQDEASVEGFPVATPMDSSAAEGNLCSVTQNEPAMFAALITFGWHPNHRRVVYLGAYAHAAYMSAEDPQAYLIEAARNA